MSDPVFPIPPTLSPSRISSFRNCPMQFRFSSIEKIPEPPQVHQVKGNFVHRVLEKLLAHLPDERTVENARVAFSEAQQEYEQNPRFLALGLEDDELTEFWTDSRGLVNGYYRMENPRDTKVLGLELRLDSDFGKFTLGGIIDRLERNNQDELVISDYKTGKTPRTIDYSNKMDNLHLYASLCLRQLGELPKKLKLMYIRSSTAFEIEVTPESNAKCEEAAIATYEQIATSCTTGIFETLRSPLCNYCAFKKWCPAFGGDPELAKTEAQQIYQNIGKD